MNIVGNAVEKFIYWYKNSENERLQRVEFDGGCIVVNLWVHKLRTVFCLASRFFRVIISLCSRFSVFIQMFIVITAKHNCIEYLYSCKCHLFKFLLFLLLPLSLFSCVWLFQLILHQISCQRQCRKYLRRKIACIMKKMTQKHDFREKERE